VSGGTTAFKNFDERLVEDLTKLMPNMEFCVNGKSTLFSSSKESYDLTRTLRNYKGACILSQITQFKDSMIKKSDYFEK